MKLKQSLIKYGALIALTSQLEAQIFEFRNIITFDPSFSQEWDDARNWNYTIPYQGSGTFPPRNAETIGNRFGFDDEPMVSMLADIRVHDSTVVLNNSYTIQNLTVTSGLEIIGGRRLTINEVFNNFVTVELGADRPSIRGDGDSLITGNGTILLSGGLSGGVVSNISNDVNHTIRGFGLLDHIPLNAGLIEFEEGDSAIITRDGFVNTGIVKINPGAVVSDLGMTAVYENQGVFHIDGVMDFIRPANLNGIIEGDGALSVVIGVTLSNSLISPGDGLDDFGSFTFEPVFRSGAFGAKRVDLTGAILQLDVSPAVNDIVEFAVNDPVDFTEERGVAALELNFVGENLNFDASPITIVENPGGLTFSNVNFGERIATTDGLVSFVVQSSPDAIILTDPIVTVAIPNEPEICSVDLAIADGWVTVPTTRRYSSPVVVTGAITENDTDATVAQVRNVTNNSFDIRLVDWGTPGLHTETETVTCIIAEEGRHEIGGLTFVAGKRNDFASEIAINGSQQTGNQNILFDPIVKEANATGAWNYAAFGQVVGEADEDGIHVRNEIAPNLTNRFRFRFEKGRNATEPVKVDEFHYFVMEAGTANSESPYRIDCSTTGRSIDHNYRTVDFSSEYETPFLMATTPIIRGGHTGAIRMRDLESDSVDVRFDEPTGWDQGHASEEVSLLRVESVK